MIEITKETIELEEAIARMNATRAELSEAIARLVETTRIQAENQAAFSKAVERLFAESTALDRGESTKAKP